MTEIIYMNKEMMQEMRRHFLKGADDLELSLNQINQISSELAEDGLIGEAGQSFNEALEGILVGKMNELRMKFIELANDIQSAVHSLDDADSDAQKEMGM